MEIDGSDKPDLRIDLTCKNVSALFEDCEFEALRGQTVKMVDITDCSLTRKQIEKLLTDCEVQSGSKGYWFKVDESGEIAGGIGKFVAPVKEELAKVLALKPNTLVVVAAGESATKSVGVMIKTFGAACEGHMDKERYEFCWIVDFPMYEIGDESGELEFCPNPFSMPSGGMEVLLKAERCREGAAGRGGWEDESPRHVYRRLLRCAAPCRYCAGRGPHGHAAGR